MYRFTKRTYRVVVLLLLVWGGSMVSCVAIYKKVDGINRTIYFEDKEAYLNYFNRKYGTDRKKIFFLKKEDYGNFLRYFTSERVSYFYGITLNDSTKIDDDFLNDNNSCFGRISGVIGAKNFQKTKRSRLAGFDLRNVDGVKLDNRKGRAAVFLLTTKLGITFYRDINKLSDEVESLHDPEITYFLISVDEPDTYEKAISGRQP